MLVPVGDEKALAAAMNRLIEEPDFAEMLGQNAAEIGKKAGAEVIFEEWKDYIDEICSQKEV